MAWYKVYEIDGVKDKVVWFTETENSDIVLHQAYIEIHLSAGNDMEDVTHLTNLGDFLLFEKSHYYHRFVPEWWAEKLIRLVRWWFLPRQ